MNNLTAFVSTMLSVLRPRVDSKDKGATMVEYGLLVALIAMVVIAALVILGPAIKDLFTNVANSL
ncbi:MAG: Flp family type IVb pilin [Propionibacterium sp.]|nr:Flp family type IVb pilin [Propionibacterium sp.]